jgi:hypothetical protein
MAKINIRTWLTWYLEVCAQNGGKVPTNIDQFLPWKMSAEKHRELAIDPTDSSWVRSIAIVLSFFRTATKAKGSIAPLRLHNELDEGSQHGVSVTRSPKGISQDVIAHHSETHHEPIPDDVQGPPSEREPTDSGVVAGSRGVRAARRRFWGESVSKLPHSKGRHGLGWGAYFGDAQRNGLPPESFEAPQRSTVSHEPD